MSDIKIWLYNKYLFFYSGVKNIQSLGNVINWQKVEYDFEFHRQEFPSNISALIISEGRSILPVSKYLSYLNSWIFFLVLHCIYLLESIRCIALMFECSVLEAGLLFFFALNKLRTL